MRVAYIDYGRISEILPEEFTSIEQAAQYYPASYIEKCQMVPDTAQVGMRFIDGEWKFPEPDPEPEVTMEELVNRVVVVENDVGKVKRGFMDVSMRISE